MTPCLGFGRGRVKISTSHSSSPEASNRTKHTLSHTFPAGSTLSKGLDKVTANTRDPKLNVEDKLSLRDSWRERAATLGFDGKSLLAQAIGRSERGGSDTSLGTERRLDEFLTGIREAVGSIFSPRDPLVDRGLDRLGLTASEYRAQHAVASVVRILEQREAAFSVPEVTRTALDLGLAGVPAEKVDARISELVLDEKLIPGKSDRIDSVVTRTNSSAAFVATNSVCQGQQVPFLWPMIFATFTTTEYPRSAFYADAG